MMKRMLLFGCMMVIGTLCTFAEITGVHASDTRFTYVGRTQVDSSDVSFDWSGTYVRVRFWGNYLAVRLSDTKKNYYNLYIDRDLTAEPDRIVTTSGDTTIVLFSAKRRRATEHTITLYKRTEGEQGRTTLHEFLVQGEILPATPLKLRQIEFIGDSYTCGYGAENSTQHDHFTPETETAAKTYAAIVARYFNADYFIVAHSGMGIARNYNSKFAGWYMPDRYCQTLDEDSTTRWDINRSAFRPQLTVILLGGNDFSVNQHPSYEDFYANYLRLLTQIKTNYGAEHPVLCCVKKGIPELTQYVRQVVSECGLTNVDFCPFYDAVFHDDERNLGADYHPNYEAHRKAAHVLIPYVSTLTDWPLTDQTLY